MLLDIDGLDVMQWGDIVSSDWEDQLGQLNGAEAPIVFFVPMYDVSVEPVLGVKTMPNHAESC